jgi:formamidopyrimidine-DNA glycosylase
MPEMPEVEVLARQLRPFLSGKTIRAVKVYRERSTRPTPPHKFEKVLAGAKFISLSRRGKYLLFELQPKNSKGTFTALGHLGMTGRMFATKKNGKLPKHASVVFDLGGHHLIFEDFRYFGRMTLDLSPIEKLGPEPLDTNFSPEMFWQSLKKSRQPIKIKLLDQNLIAGVGNIYASEALNRARISPKLPANRLTLAQAKKLLHAIRNVLNDSIKAGSTVALKAVEEKSGALFYFDGDDQGYYERRLRVYDRAGKPCLNCRTKILRVSQAARSTYFCPRCQRMK